MEGFHRKNGVLHVDNIPLPEIAKTAGTPTYVYSASIIRQQFSALRESFSKFLPADRQPLLCYACKANSNIAILKLLQGLGAGLEIVSEGELYRGAKAGFTGDKIISTSFGKEEEEIKACLSANIHQFNIESPDELAHVNRYAGESGKVAKVLFRLNPDVQGGGHSKIQTGKKTHKFGNSATRILELYKIATEMENVEPVGVSVHIGSQVSTVSAFKPAFERLAELVQTLREQGHKVTRLDIGGGFPIVYKDEDLLDLDAYARWVNDIIVPLDTEIQMEPGRYMVGNAGILLTETLYIKKTQVRNFLVLDAAMNDLMRPALYDAWHGIEPVSNADRTPVTYDVVGPVCESGDIFAANRDIPEIREGELVAIRSAGAYGFSMASNYNSRPLPAEIMVDGDNVATIRERQTMPDLIKGESISYWLT